MEKVPCAFVILKFVILVFIGAHGGKSMCFCNFEKCNFGIHLGGYGCSRAIHILRFLDLGPRDKRIWLLYLEEKEYQARVKILTHPANNYYR